MTILAIDPGNERSAWVIYDAGTGELVEHGYESNDVLMERIYLEFTPRDCCIEMIASYGMAVGREVFETCVFIGQLMEAWRVMSEDAYPTLVYRREVKMHLCGCNNAKDPNVRQALIDRFGGKDKAIGKKASPGPLYGVSGDVWQALAVAVTYADRSPAPAATHAAAEAK